MPFEPVEIDERRIRPKLQNDGRDGALQALRRFATAGRVPSYPRGFKRRFASERARMLEIRAFLVAQLQVQRKMHENRAFRQARAPVSEERRYATSPVGKELQ